MESSLSLNQTLPLEASSSTELYGVTISYSTLLLAAVGLCLYMFYYYMYR